MVLCYLTLCTCYDMGRNSGSIWGSIYMILSLLSIMSSASRPGCTFPKICSQLNPKERNGSNSFKELNEGEDLILEASVLGPCDSTILKHVFIMSLNNTTSQKNACSEASNNIKGIQIHQLFRLSGRQFYIHHNRICFFWRHISVIVLLGLQHPLNLCYIPSSSNKWCAPKALQQKIYWRWFSCTCHGIHWMITEIIMN